MEQRLIDANAIKLEKGFFEKVDNVPKFYEWLSEQPTVDAVPVVRCRQCEYYSNEMNCCSYVNGLQNVTKTDYCSYGRCADGERRSDGE